MHVGAIARFSLLGLTLAACRTAPVAREPGAIPLTSLFGPVISSEVIGGRQDDGDGVWLLVGGTSLVHIDLATRIARRVAIPLAPGEQCWSLARLQDGSLWTLKGRDTLIQVDAGGAIGKTVTLTEPHLGLFGAGQRLIYQSARFTPPSPALRAGEPGDSGAAPWSGMTTRAFDRLPRGSAMALNMVACGGSAVAERPCWFPDEAALSLIDADGATRRLALPGLTVVTPDVLLAAENPARPVRDAYVDRQGRVWVLSSGTPPQDQSDRPGGWILARYSRDGAPDGLVGLQESARLILRADGDRAIVLSGAGHVSEVRPW
jgi:hypothetical protein